MGWSGADSLVRPEKRGSVEVSTLDYALYWFIGLAVIHPSYSALPETQYIAFRERDESWTYLNIPLALLQETNGLFITLVRHFDELPKSKMLVF